MSQFRFSQSLWSKLALAAGGFLLILLILMATEVGPLAALRELVQGAVGSPAGWRDTLREMTPLMLAGMAVFIALRAGLFNIGAEGQMLVGAMATAVIALRIEGVIGMILAILGGILAGAAWAYPAGWIKAMRGGHEVITTIMMNNIAGFLTLGLVAGPLRDQAQQSATTPVIDASVQLPWIVDQQPFRLNIAWLLALLLVPVLAWFLKRTAAGFEVRATGANPTAAKFAGVDTKKITIRTMSASGGLAGLAGAFQVLAYEGRFYAGLSSGYGFDALGVALLSAGAPWAIIPSAFLFGAITKGTTSLQLLDVSKGISGVLLGVIVIVYAAFKYRRQVTHA